MSPFKKYKFISYGISGSHYKGTFSISGFISAKGRTMLKGSCTKCKKKSMNLSEATTQDEGLRDFIKNVGEATINFEKKVPNNPITALEISSKIGK